MRQALQALLLDRRLGLAALAPPLARRPPPPPPRVLLAGLSAAALRLSAAMAPRRPASTSAAAAAAAAEPAVADDPAAGGGAPAAARRGPGRPRKDGSPPRAPPGAPRAAAKRPKPLPPPSLAVSTSLRTLRPKAARIAEQLGRLYPSPPIPLAHGSAFQLLAAVMLSAQTTDAAVNRVTPQLFALAPDAAAMAALGAPRIAGVIRALGLAPTKARNLAAAAEALVRDHGGEVPADGAALQALPGVGRKTASVVLSQAFGLPALPVDTHVHRLAQRWGLTVSTAGASVEQTEADLRALWPEAAWRDLHLQVILFGRERCPARGHDPAGCPVCCWAAVPPFDRPGTSPVKAGGKRAAGAAGAARKRPAAGAGKRRRARSEPAESGGG